MNSSQGSYVLEKALHVAKGTTKKKLLGVLKKKLEVLWDHNNFTKWRIIVDKHEYGYSTVTPSRLLLIFSYLQPIQFSEYELCKK